ncbi:MAG: DNA-3-methyladenine glycosylase I [Candidatus Thermoplasmatota archaeon]|nr:DNA-3-methyladenine glycosylase I [Candidatus Thermoplasmatota archaeon]
MKRRCPWVDTEDQLSVDYHDREWGVPVHDDRKLFEFLVLEGAQAGLNWTTILRKRENYRRVFAGFEPKKVASFDKKKIGRLLEDPGIVRNRLKVESAISNARAVLDVRKECGSLDRYMWSFVSGRPIQNSWKSPGEVPVASLEAKRMSADLRRRGFGFVGPTICYSFMQAVGMVNDHLVDCFRHSEVR